MPKYLCPKCKGVFCGWVMKYKYKEKCPVCDSELREVYPDNKESRKVEGSHKEAPEDSLSKLFRIDI
jgi:transcription initiation factor IIE alpha subunit